MTGSTDDLCPLCGKGTFRQVDLGEQQPESREVRTFTCGHEVEGARLETSDSDRLTGEAPSARHAMSADGPPSLRGIRSHDVDIRTLPKTIGRTRREALRFLATPAGERWRHRAAWVLVVALPLVFRIPVLRKHWALRFLELAGGAAILVKLGQAVRDWEPSPAG